MNSSPKIGNSAHPDFSRRKVNPEIQQDQSFDREVPMGNWFSQYLPDKPFTLLVAEKAQKQGFLFDLFQSKHNYHQVSFPR